MCVWGGGKCVGRWGPSVCVGQVCGAGWGGKCVGRGGEQVCGGKCVGAGGQVCLSKVGETEWKGVGFLQHLALVQHLALRAALGPQL